ncbi:hypothetical protein BGZ54_005402 [Gamsiella multidivaricata]|nr:hypothetical protein BGZ54_005402 [Gamsiella multidivaricata]
MSSSAPTVKDLYKTITADFTAYLSKDKPREQESSRETLQQYLDRFIKSNSASTASTGHSGGHSHASTPTTSFNAGGHTPSSAAQVLGNAAAGGVTPGTLSNVDSPNPVAGSSTAPVAAGQRYANELWYQSLTNNAILQHSNNLPFAFHRLSQTASSVGSPSSSAPASQNASTTGSPVIGGGQGVTHPATPALTVTTPNTGPNNSSQSSQTAHSTSTAAFNVANIPVSSPLAAQRFSAHLITMFTQHNVSDAPIADVATRMIVYLTHLLPFLTPRLVITDWWDRLIQPCLQGEIKLEKDAMKSCRDLVTECMIRDNILDSHGSGTGSLLVAGDEEGQLGTSLAKAAMPVSQFVLRKYIRAAHRLNHRLSDEDYIEKELQAEGISGFSLRANASRAGHGTLPTGSVFTPSSSPSVEYTTTDLERQQQLLAKARAIIRRKKDFLVKNLEVILFTYGGNVGRVKDFFSCLYTYFVGALYRPEILGLLCQFIRRQRVHLHQILATPLFDSLLFSLKYDTSPLIVSLGLMTLIMLMPRIPAALNERLPDLFLILSRILCWPRSRQQLMASFDEFDDEGPKADATGNNINDASSDKGEGSAFMMAHVEFEDISLYNHGIRWRRYGPALAGGSTEGAPDPTAIFSFLYGLFPCNLLKFLHGPRVYMKQAHSPIGSPRQSSGSQVGEGDSAESDTETGAMYPKDANDKAFHIDEDLLKSRVQALLKRHSLHPDLLTLTSEQEIASKARWQKLEPMEIVAMCVGLDVWSAGGQFGTGPVLRSIEEDRKGTYHQDSGEDDDDNEMVQKEDGGGAHTAVFATASNEKSVKPSPVPDVKAQDHSLQSQALTSVESLASQESEGTPNEILAQEDFFGPYAVKDQQGRATHSMPAGGFQRAYVGPGSGVQPLPRTRTRSKEVKMSQILRNFATLRGLDHEGFQMEIQGIKHLEQDSRIRERRPSLLSNTEGAAALTAVATATATATAATDYDDMPAEKSPALTARADPGQDSLLRPTSMATLVIQNQDYRKTILNLERELLMAKNELNFELFLKQQHIQQIFKVHRAHVLDASVEAERQSLYNTCRSLKAQLQETRLLLEKEKSELEKRKNKQTHWDTELKNKMQNFRDERKQLQFEVERLKQDIKDTRQAQEIHERLLVEERKGTFDLKNAIEDLSPKLKRMEEYEKRIEVMTRQLVLWESEQTKMVEMQRQMETVVSRWQNLELLLRAEKEEARNLRNKVSQQSQVLDDMRIQMAINDGREPGDVLYSSIAEYHSDEEELDEGREHDDGEGADPRAVYGIGSEQVERERTIRRKPSRSLRHHSSTVELNWPLAFTRSNSTQQGFEQQRRASAMQEFMVREKERWDKELQEAHNRWSREAVRNQQLEDRILELQGQLEMARAIDMRQIGGQGGHNDGHQGGHNGGHQGGHQGGYKDDQGDGGGGGGGGGGMRMMNVTLQPQNVSFVTTTGSDIRMRTSDHYDTDDGGIESSEMIGRYSRQQRDSEEADDSIYARMRSAAGPLNESPPQQSTGKGKSSKQKSKGKQAPTGLGRAQTDRGTNGDGTAVAGMKALQSHLGANTPGLFDLGSRPFQQRKSTESSSTMNSSSAATRAATSGLFPPTLYARNVSHLSDYASSDVTTASDTSTICSVVRGERSAENGGADDDGNHATEFGSTSATSSAGSSSKKGSKSKADKERDRERERIRLMSGMGPLVDPSKMYRNVRMF